MTELARAIWFESLYRRELADIGAGSKAAWVQEMTDLGFLEYREPGPEPEAVIRWCAETCGFQIIVRLNGEIVLSGLPAAPYWLQH